MWMRSPSCSVDALDSLAVDESSILHREISQHVVGAAPLDHRMPLLHAVVAEEPDRIFLGAPDRCARAFEAILPSAQPTLLDGEPRGLGQLLHQSDEQSDREADDASPKNREASPPPMI